MLCQGNKRKFRTPYLQSMPGSTVYKNKATQVKAGMMGLLPGDGDTAEDLENILARNAEQLRFSGFKKKKIIRGQALHVTQQKLLFSTDQEYGKGFGTESQQTASSFRSAILAQQQYLLFHGTPRPGRTMLRIFSEPVQVFLLDRAISLYLARP